MRFVGNAAYVGAGADLRPIDLMPAIGMFVYVDTQPYTEFPGTKQVRGFQRPRMWDDVQRGLARRGFAPSDDGAVVPLAKNVSTRVMFRSHDGKRAVAYWFNTAWHADLVGRREAPTGLLADLLSCRHLVVAGFNPHASILDALYPAPIELITMHGTVYSSSEGEDEYGGEGAFARLHTDAASMSRIANVWYFAASKTASARPPSNQAPARFKHLRDVATLALKPVPGVDEWMHGMEA